VWRFLRSATRRDRIFFNLPTPADAVPIGVMVLFSTENRVVAAARPS